MIRKFSIDEIKVSKKFLKVCSTFFVLREVEIKNILRFYFPPVRMTKIKSANDSLLWTECRVRKTLLKWWWEYNLHSQFGNQYGGLSENWESISLKTQRYHSWTYTKGYSITHKYTWSTLLIVYLFIIVRIRKKTRCPATKKWTKNVVHLHNVILIRYWNNDIMKFSEKLIKLSQQSSWLRQAIFRKINIVVLIYSGHRQ